MRKEVAVIGGGWYGCHIAKYLAEQNFKVTLLEKNSNIFGGVSGKFGVRAHRGPHYPRSPFTQESCREGFSEFSKTYPELLYETNATYALGSRDADNLPSRVSLEQFKAVCEKFPSARTINLPESGYRNIIYAADFEEPSFPVGKRLVSAFQNYLKGARVTVTYNFEVSGIEKIEQKITVKQKNGPSAVFDHVVNTTNFQTLLPKRELPLQMEVVYQPRFALIYEDTQNSEPFSFTVMDGSYPCIMPYADDGLHSRKYIVTHCKWTSGDSHKNPGKAYQQLASITDKFIENEIKPRCEREMIRFWPAFEERFKYQAWVGTVLAKINTKTAFSTAVTFQDNDTGVINIISGKVANIFSSARETLSLIEQTNVITDGSFRYVEKGVLDQARGEITGLPKGMRIPLPSLPEFPLKKLNTIPRNNPISRVFFILGSLIAGLTLIYFTKNSLTGFSPISTLSSVSTNAGTAFGFILLLISAYKTIRMGVDFISSQSRTDFFHAKPKPILPIYIDSHGTVDTSESHLSFTEV